MSGYVRQDVTNELANGNVVDADILNSEFDALAAAYDNTTGHVHDGTTGNGAPITVIGPIQDVIVSGTALLPKTDNTYDLGSALKSWKGFWADGTSTLASLVATTVDINAGTIDATVIGATTPAAITGTTVGGTTITASVGFVGSLTGNLTSSNSVITGGSINGTTVGATTASTVRGTVVTATTNFAGNLVGNVTGNVTGNTTGTSTGPVVSSAVTITGGTITGITDLAIADGGTGASTGAAALSNFGLTATIAEINKLSGVTATTAEINKLTGVTATTAEINKLAGLTSTTAELNKLTGATATTAQLNFVTGVTSAIQTQMDTKAPLASPTLTGVPVAPTAAIDTNTTQIATTAYVVAQISDDVGVANSSLVKTAVNASGSAPIYGCRAHAMFNGVAGVSIIGSANIASITRTGVGIYDVLFTTAMPNGNYTVVTTGGGTTSSVLSSGLISWSHSRVAAGFTMCIADNNTDTNADGYGAFTVFG